VAGFNHKVYAVEKRNQRQSDQARLAKYKGPPQKRAGRKGRRNEYFFLREVRFQGCIRF